MQRLGGAVILMQKNLNLDVLDRVSFLTGSKEIFESTVDAPSKKPFADDILEFLNDVSKEIMTNRNARAFSDVITFGFWIRKASLQALKERFVAKNQEMVLGKGLIFHIAPSNVPVNFAYTLIAGLVSGNKNIVRVPTKPFPQVDIIVESINKVLKARAQFKPYIMLVRYERSQEINDIFSAVADERVVWGGDRTIEELRKSPLPPRSGEITFADRYSMAVIDAESYLQIYDKEKTIEDFYNDTYFSDQNACTSPRIIIWLGNNKKEAKEDFWSRVENYVRNKYTYQAIQGVNKLTSSYILAANKEGIKVLPHSDNYVVRISVPKIDDDLIEYRDNCGYFLEYDSNNILDIKNICNDKRCQTIAYIGNPDMFIPLINSGVKGIDRIVKMGKTMDFDLIWDGYNLISHFTRNIFIR